MRAVTLSAGVAVVTSILTAAIVGGARPQESRPGPVEHRWFFEGTTAIRFSVRPDGEVEAAASYSPQGDFVYKRELSIKEFSTRWIGTLPHAPRPSGDQSNALLGLEGLVRGAASSDGWEKLADGPAPVPPEHSFENKWRARSSVLVGGATVRGPEVGFPDSWGRPYLFRKIGDEGFEVYSLGADGKAGGEGDDADLTVRWKK